ncbi:MAG: amino acid adenylation domain-containing protein, partial [Anaerolineales bacterium]|nr:amino acid adenylation domain-containing protein [Anaerolineales bacterium]
MWFLYAIAPQAVAYNLAGAAAVPENTDLRALERAFRRLADRHPMLRATFAAPGGEPVQRVHPIQDFPFRVVDASAWDPADRDERLASAIQRPFDLEQGPAWRVLVLQGAPLEKEHPESRSASRHLVLLTLHHIIGDLWSTAVLTSELAALYREEVTGPPAQLKPLRSTYADHVYREREMLAGPRGRASWDYWRNVLDVDLPSLELPTDRPRSTVLSNHGAREAFLLGPEVTQRLRKLAEVQHVSLQTLLLAALQTLLHRYTGQDDIITGFPKAGRSAVTARVIGYFVNLVPVRARFADDPRFSDVLRRTQRALDESSEHDWYPFPVLVSRLRPARDLSRSPLIQVVFSWQKTTRLVPDGHARAFGLGQAGHRLEVGGLQLSTVPLPHQTASFDLTVTATETPDGLAVTMEYSTDLFDATTIRRLAGCYRSLLDSILSSPDRSVSRLDILTSNERKQLLVDWNATTAPYPQRCLHQLFEDWASRQPEVLAVKCEDQELTYGELNRRANQVARYLLQQGIHPGASVGLCCEPSLQTIIGLLGILKAGAAYLPIDPYYPRDRQAFMLNDARAPVLVTHAAVRDRLPHFAGAILDLDTDWLTIRQQPETNPPVHVDPDGMAYLIFTSGSTGQPKGSALAHRGVVNLLADFQLRQPIAPGDPCSWWTSFSFDVSVYEIFSPLLAGGTLHVIPQALRLDPPALLAWLHAQRIRHAYLPPFLLADLAAWLERNPGQSELRRLLVGVEPIPEQLLMTISAQLPQLRIINGYGPSETTICSSLYDVDTTRSARGKTPIGKPVINTQIYLLDRHLQPVPVGVTGEIYIGGIGLSRGYLNRPDLTAQRFLLSPFTREPGAYLYRTGDLARHLPDGNLEFLGRSDDQVKIHGMRIEPAEIEAALCLHPAIGHAAVLARPDDQGELRLVAYLVPTGIPPPSPQGLRRFLAQSLPVNMLPHTFVVVDALPRTPNGKLDRRGLPAPEEGRPQRDRTVSPSSTEPEEVLASIWRNVLKIETVSVDDNFFELGGDSISAMQVVSQAARAGLHLSPKHLFQAPTIAGLAAIADGLVSTEDPPEQGSLAGAFPLTPIQHWFFELASDNPHHWNQALMFRTPQSLNPLHMCAATEALLAHHDALRLRFVSGPKGWRQSYAELGEEVPFEVVNLANLSEHQRRVALEQRAAALQRSLNLSTGPLIRVVFFDLGAHLPGRLFIVIHHLAVDAVSWRILLEDLQTAYRQLEHGQAVHLPSKTTSFGDWAQHLADLAHTGRLEEETMTWLTAALGARMPSPVGLSASDRAANLNTEGTARRHATCLGKEDTRKLIRLAATAHGTRVEGVLLTALARAFRRWTGSSTLWVDLEGHGREDLFEGVDLSRTVGWFTSLCPVRIDVSEAENQRGSPDASEPWLPYIPRSRLGYGLLRYQDAGRFLSAAVKAVPRPEVSFNYLGQITYPTGGDLICGPAPESVGPMRWPDAPRAYVHEVTAAIIEGELQVDWTYSFQMHEKATIELVAGFFTSELRRLISSLGSRLTSLNAGSEAHIVKLSPSELKPSSGSTNLETLADLPMVDTRVECAYPLSPMQQGMLFHTLEAPHSGVYIEQITCTLDGPLDIAAFTGSWRHLLERHAILRTAFSGERIDRMLQVIYRDVELQMDVYDWRSLSASEQETRFEALLRTDRERGVDPGAVPLWGLTLVHEAKDRHRCLLRHHHALLDGWSVSLLFQEFSTLYKGMVQDLSVTLPPVRPYRDYIDWLATRDLAAGEAFWRTALSGCVPGPLVAARHPTAAHADPGLPAERESRLSPQDTSALRRMARQQRLTLNTIVQGAWSLLLGRHAQRGEVIYGMTVAGRSPDLAGSESMVGLFINTLPMRVRIEPSARLGDWLDGLQRRAAEIQQYAYCPLVRIQSWSGAQAGRSLFDTIVAFENYPLEALLPGEGYGLRISNVRAMEQTNYPLALAVVPGERLR